MRYLICVFMLLPCLSDAQFIEVSFPAPGLNISGLAFDGGVWALDSLDCVIYRVHYWTGAPIDTVELPPLPNPAVGLAVYSNTLLFAESGTALIHAIDFDGNLIGSWDFSDSGIQSISGLDNLPYSNDLYLLDSSDRSIYYLEGPIGTQPPEYLFAIADTIEVHDIGAWMMEGVPVACDDEISPVRFYTSPSSYQTLGYGTYESAVGVTSIGIGRIYFSDPELGMIHRYCVNMGGNESGSSASVEPVILSIYPNPVLTSTTLVVYLASGCSTTIRLFDVSGRVVWSKSLGLQAPGYHDISIEISDPGIYFCRMTSGDISATQRFVVIE
jgi:hypothetical protein